MARKVSKKAAKKGGKKKTTVPAPAPKPKLTPKALASLGVISAVERTRQCVECCTPLRDGQRRFGKALMHYDCGCAKRSRGYVLETQPEVVVFRFFIFQNIK